MPNFANMSSKNNTSTIKIGLLDILQLHIEQKPTYLIFFNNVTAINYPVELHAYYLLLLCYRQVTLFQ